MNQTPRKRWIHHSARLSKLLADRGMIVMQLYVIAILVGFIAVGFAILADHATEWQKELYFDHPLIAYLLPPITLPACLWLVNRYFWGAGGSGIPQAVKVIKHPKPRLISRLIGPRAFVGKFLLTPLVIASGAAIGREGPTVQLGASLMMLSRKLPGIARVFDSQSLIIAGGAAGVAAAFNTPLGGLMFAFEELGRKRTLRHTSTLLMAVVLAGLVSLMIQGNYSYFGYSNATIDWKDQWLNILILSIGSGIVGGLYGRLMLTVVSSRTRMGAFRARRPYVFAMLCGVVISIMAMVFGSQVFGAGYEDTKLALQESQSLSPSFWIIKLASTLTAFASGAPGGVFAPTLSIGAGFGHFFAGITAQEAAPFMILAMVGVLSAVTHAPITAFVIVLEMVDNHGFIMPMIMTAALSTQVSRRILPTSIYELLARNIRIQFAAEPEKVKAEQQGKSE